MKSWDNPEAHAQYIEAQNRYLTVQELASRWRVSTSTIYDIPFERLPYFVVGNGVKKIHRRYSPSDVASYEASGRRGSA